MRDVNSWEEQKEQKEQEQQEQQEKVQDQRSTAIFSNQLPPSGNSINPPIPTTLNAFT
ncbi:GD17525 [Drosophila simulans]|uniref:GD17525 n=1 Tax=Drosophila simulans TaxID=7240 RepID=B4R3Q5_DROSI|nr:GD17525 [Drosophila simulans]